jgi:2-amino-4-hydroxy-6-hydroxymethyldihydropteridine diphosphokinase
MNRRTGYLGLGSNVGDRRANLEAAVATLPAHGVEVLASSSVYETEPVGEVADQREFLNACLRIRTGHGPEELLDACKAVERELGREPGGVRHGPRPIDVDVLLLGDLVYGSERLRLPHAEVTSRRFVLTPLLELDPDLRIPTGERAADALAALGPDQEVRRDGPPVGDRAALPPGTGGAVPATVAAETPDGRSALAERLARQREAHRGRPRIVRLGVVVAGFAVTGVGIAMLVLPGPALVVIPIGLGMLALEFRWAERLLERALDQAEEARRRARETTRRQRVMTAAAGVLALAAFAVAAVLWDIPLLPV